MDFKKLRKSSSKKLLKGGLGFFLSPRDDNKETVQETSSPKDVPLMTSVKKSNDWGSNNLKQEKSDNGEENNKDFIDDIPVIPSIDDFTDDDLTNQIAQAPSIGVKQLATYNELENDILKLSAFSGLEEVNLQVLIKFLHPESSLIEPDSPWTKDGLFSELVNKINERKK